MNVQIIKTVLSILEKAFQHTINLWIDASITKTNWSRGWKQWVPSSSRMGVALCSHPENRCRIFFSIWHSLVFPTCSLITFNWTQHGVECNGDVYFWTFYFVTIHENVKSECKNKEQCAINVIIGTYFYQGLLTQLSVKQTCSIVTSSCGRGGRDGWLGSPGYRMVSLPSVCRLC